MLEMRKIALAAVIAMLVGVPGIRSYAQITTGSILGTIADETGARTPGATVTVTNTETGIARTLTADAAGRYRAANLPLGQYEVKAELSGFRTAVRRGIELSVGAEVVADLSLSVGAVNEQVQVTGEAPMVDTTSSTVSGLVADQQVRDLPLNGRSFESLIFLQAGTSGFLRGDKSAEAGNGTKLTVSGSRIDANSFLLDGANMSDQSSMTPGSAAGVLMGVDILREFRVLTSNYSAEYGRVSGGIINAVTKSGTNNLHGDVFEYLRNSAFDARSFFDQEKPAFRRNQFGATLGGPIKKDRTFFFVSYEGLRQGLGVTQISIVPSAEAHAGILRDSAGNAVPTAINPAVKPYLDLYPLPNAGVLPGPGGVLTSSARFINVFGLPTREDFGNIRVDHQISANHSFFARYTLDDSQTSSANPNLLLLDVFARNQYATVSETAIISPTVVNLARMSFSRPFAFSNNRLLYNVPRSLWFLPTQQFGAIVFQSGGFDVLGNIISQPQQWARQNWTVTDDLTFTRGRHTLKTGFLFERYEENGYKQRIYGGQYTFANLGTFLANNPFDIQAEPPGNDPIRGWRQSLFGGYFQDDIQLRNNLTLNAGLRYEFAQVPKEVNGKLSNYPNPLTDVGSAPHIGDPWFKGGNKDFAPRVGLAWDPFSNGKTSLRAGFGLYYDHITGAPYNRAISRVYPFHQFVAVRNGPTSVVTFPNVNPSFLTAPNPNTFVSYALNGWMPDPTKVSWTFSIQQQLASSTVITAAYVGSHSYHMTLASNGNQAIEAQDSSGNWYVPQPAKFRNPNIGQLSFFMSNVGNAFYDGLQLGLTRRMAKGFQAQFSYTWSKTISEGDGVLGRFFDRESRAGSTTVVNVDNIRTSERSLAQTDFRNVASANFSYELPFAKNLSGVGGKLLSGWAVNSIVSATSGSPLNLSMGFVWTNANVSGGTYQDRPDLKPGGNNNPVLGGPNKYYDASQFVLPQQIVSSTGTVTGRYFGNLGRMTLVSPGLATVDFSLVKNTALHFRSEGLTMQFRAELFNILNRANFGLPFNQPITSTGAVDPRAAVIDRTVTPGRQVQFALKFVF